MDPSLLLLELVAEVIPSPRPYDICALRSQFSALSDQQAWFKHANAAQNRSGRTMDGPTQREFTHAFSADSSSAGNDRSDACHFDKETVLKINSDRRHLLNASLGLAAAGATSLLGNSAIASESKRPPRTYMLIHGAWHGGWVWKDTARALRAMGHEVYAPSLTGLGDRRHLLNPSINLDTHAADVVNLMEMEDLKNIVLVGWSYGGMVAAEVLARATSRIGSMVYLDAFVPERGKSLADYAGPPAERFRQAAASGQDISAIPLSVFGVTDPGVIAHVSPRLSLQPAQTFVQPSKALAVRPSIPHTYVRASGFASAGFDAFLKQFQSDPTAKAVTLATSHLLMLTDPVATLRLLAEAA